MNPPEKKSKETGCTCGKGLPRPAKPRDSGQTLKQALTGFQGVRISLSTVIQPTTLMIPAVERVSLGDTTNHPDLKALMLVPIIQNEYMPSTAIQDRTSPVTSWKFLA